jgi:hypothetical protein
LRIHHLLPHPLPQDTAIQALFSLLKLPHKPCKQVFENPFFLMQNDHFQSFIVSTKKLLENTGQNVQSIRNKLELNENPSDLIPSNLTDQQFDYFMSLPLSERQGNMSHWITKNHFDSDSEECFLCKQKLVFVKNNCQK